MSIKNFWSLHVDEALVASELKKQLSSNYEVFFPVNSQVEEYHGFDRDKDEIGYENKDS